MSPMNLADYHSDWDSISRQIREQAGQKCEFCGVPNGAQGYRLRRAFVEAEAPVYQDPYFPRRCFRVVLTVAHLCHDTTCYDPTHLRALCQACHLRYDAKHHARNAAETRRAKRMATGQGALL